MSDIVTIPHGESGEDTAVLLLDAAISLDLPASVVTTGSFKNFYAPKEVAEVAGVDYVDDNAVDAPEVQETPGHIGAPQAEVTEYADSEGDATTFDPADHNVEDVLRHISKNPDQREAVIKAEQQGKNRVTITESQE